MLFKNFNIVLLYSLPLTPSRSSQRLSPANFIFFFSLNKQKWNLIWTTHSCSWGLPWSLVGMSSDISLKTSPTNYQLWIASWLGVRLSPLDAEILSALSLCRSSAGSHRLCAFICAPALLCMENTKVIHHFWFTVFLSAPRLLTPPFLHIGLLSQGGWRQPF